MPQTDRRADRLTQVTAQVDYHRQRLVLFRRLHGSGPSARLFELEQAYRSAQDRLTAATGPAPDPGPRRRAALD
jgi:hypothetical protein